MTARLLILRSIYGGDLSGRTLVMPTFGHPSGDRGTSVTDDPRAPGGLLVKVHNGGGRADDLATKDALLRDLGEGQDRQRGERRQIIAPQQRRQAQTDAEREAAERRRRARAIWDAARDPRGTLVEAYLRSRSLDLGDDVAGSAIRYLERCPWEGSTAPAMVAAMRDIGTGEVVAIHRTALTPEGRKLGRKMLGPVRGAAVMMDPPEAVSTGLAIGEGIESVMAARQLGIRSAWALGSIGAIAGFPVLPGVETLSLLAENDANGASERGCHEVGQRWHRARRLVDLVRPKVGKDMNDVVREQAAR